jgi:hypothetical protein
VLIDAIWLADSTALASSGRVAEGLTGVTGADRMGGRRSDRATGLTGRLLRTR